MGRGGRDDEARRAFAVQAARGTFDGLELAFLDPDDEDDRALLIRAEHPELASAIDRGVEEIEVDGHPMNPRLHLTIHEVVANQLWEDDPPEVWQTARRLLDAGYERHEIPHMLGSAVSTGIWAAIHGSEPVAAEDHGRALQRLPASWEEQRQSG